MKPLCTAFLALPLISFCLNINFCFAQNEHEHEEIFQDDRLNNPLKEYSFMGNYSKENKRAFFPLEKSYRTYNFNSDNKIQSSAFSDIFFFGPYNCAGRTRAILADRTDPNLIFAGTTTGGLWRSTNAGQSWTPINDQTVGMNLSCIEQNPFDPNIIYYGTGEHKNRKIEDKGNGIYKSIDHGQTFSQIPGTNTSSFQLINAIKHSLVDPNTIYVATTFNGLYRSTDAGTTYQTIFDNGEKITDIECFTNGKIMCASSYDGIYYSATGDSGTFTKATGIPASGISRIEMAYCDSFPLIMYAMIADSVQTLTACLQGAYKSTDGGVSWFSITNPSSTGVYPFTDFILGLVVKPDDPDFIVVGGGQGDYSIDGGQTFTHLQYPRFDHHAFVFNKFNNNILYIGNDQGLNSFDLTQLPLNDVDLVHTYNTLQIWGGTYFPTGNNFLLGAQDNSFCKNANEDSMFVRMSGYGSDGKSVHVNQQDPNISYICGDFAEVFKSYNSMNALPVYTHILNELDTNSDGAVDDDVWHVNALEMNYLDGNQLYLPTRDHVWRTINGGTNWTKITNSFAGGNTPRPVSVGISNAVQPTVYSAGSKGFFIRIDNAYNTVAGQEVDLSSSVPPELIANGRINCLAVHPLNEAIVYATVFDLDSVSRVWKIIDANTASPQWIDINSNLDRTVNTYWIEMDPDHPDSVLFVGTDYGLYSTTDAGTTWFRETDIPMISIFQMRLRRTDRQLFVYTFGRGIWIAQLPGWGVGIDSPSYNGAINIFPNPSNGIINIDVLQKDLRLNDIAITDISGRLIRKINYDAEDNLQTSFIDLSKESGGIYFLNIKTNNGEVRKKFIKVNAER